LTLLIRILSGKKVLGSLNYSLALETKNAGSNASAVWTLWIFSKKFQLS
jgi:hypothetical protein